MNDKVAALAQVLEDAIDEAYHAGLSRAKDEFDKGAADEVEGSRDAALKELVRLARSGLLS